MTKVFQPAGVGSSTCTNSIAATTVSAARELPAGGGTNLVFYNDGPGLMFVAVGDSNVSASAPVVSGNTGAAGGALIPVGQAIPISIDLGMPGKTMTHWACISASTSTGYCTRGEGA